jgi:hypothetical protein
MAFIKIIFKLKFVYSTVTSKTAEIGKVEFRLSVLAVDNFETRVVQQFGEFSKRI